WGDKYQWSLAFQWIDITGLRGGDYKVCVVVDAQDWFAELSQSNNYQWSDVRIPSSGSTVGVLRNGTSACAP
ncbi:MAG TPA: lysyl oxidase family protein, partial [Opitutaceae bacterium]|nr:lysyl oxidase family protein [Opitutaceae bacterium]